MNKYSITSNEIKLFKHLDHLQNLQQKMASPVMVVVSPTNRCNLKCLHCCFDERDKTLEINFNDLKNSLNQFKDLNIKSVELAGGGEPTLFTHIDDLISYVTTDLDLKMGMNTNGVALHNVKNVREFEWVRLSLNFFDFDYIDKDRIIKTINEIKNDVNVTACYIIPQQLKYINVEKVIQFANDNKILTRIAPDCVQSKDNIKIMIEETNNILSKHIQEYCFCSDFNIFLQERRNNFCGMHLIKPLLFTDNKVYNCPSFELAKENGTNVSDKFFVCNGKDVYDYYTNNFETFNKSCSYCKYAKQNELLDFVLQETTFNEFV